MAARCAALSSQVYKNKMSNAPARASAYAPPSLRSLRPRRPRMQTYSVAIVAMAVAFLLVRWMENYFTPTPATLFLCAILFSSLWGGLEPALLTVVSSILIFDFFYIAPRYSFEVALIDIPRIVTFSFTAIFVGVLGTVQNIFIKSLREAYARLAIALQALKHTNATLERDNAERARIQEQLRYSEAFLKEAQRISQTGSWRWHAVRRELIWSDEHFRIFGYDYPGGPAAVSLFSERVHPEDAAMVSRIATRAMERGERFECEYRIVLPGGVVRYLYGVGCPISEAPADAHEYIGTTVDITARRLTEERLRKSEQEFRTLAENSPDGVIRYDLDCRRIYANPAYFRATGLTPGQVMQRPLENGWGSDTSVEEYVDFLRCVMRTGMSGQIMGTWIDPLGQRTHYSAHVVAERDRKGDVVSVLAIRRDITGLKKAEQELEESQRQLRRLADRSETEREQERKHLARELHDDLAQYLSALRMRISILHMQFGNTVPELQTEIRSLLTVVDTTIRMTRNVITALRPAALDMGIVSALQWLRDEFAVRTGIECRLDITVTDDCLCERNATVVFRVVQESLRNIEKHAEAGQVDIRFERNGALLGLRICDNGVGFDPAVKHGQSFGLLGMQERVLMLGGTVDILTAPGRGTEIRVDIPVVSTAPDR